MCWIHGVIDFKHAFLRCSGTYGYHAQEKPPVTKTRAKRARVMKNKPSDKVCSVSYLLSDVLVVMLCTWVPFGLYCICGWFRNDE